MTFSSFFSRRALPVLAVVLFLTSLHARGAVTTYEFTGTLTDIRESGAGFSYGDTFYARYTHDDAPQTGSLIEPDRMLFSGGQFSVWSGSSALVGPSSTELQVFNNWTNIASGFDSDDGFFVSSRIYDSTGFYLIQFDLWDFTGNTLSALSIPSQDELIQLAHNGRIFIRRFDDTTGETGLASGNFAEISAVPEPNIVFLFSLGLVSLVVYRKWRIA